MKSYIFNIGLNRAGTNSLTAALNILGIPSIHYMSHEGQQILELVENNIKDNKNAFDSLDDTYQGFSDFAGELFLETIYNQYPNSKFIFTNRNPCDWIKSKTFLWEVIKKESAVECTIDDYNKKTQLIKDFFKDKPKDIFLEINICDGPGLWKTLCPFLDKEIPNIDFPHLHRSHSYTQP